MTVHWIDWTVIIAYMVAMVLIGWWAGRGTRSLSDYFVGGRNVSSFATGLSLVATLLSTISYLAYPGEVIAHGTGFVWQIAVLPIVFGVVGYLLVPHIMSLPVSSAYELLETRLGPSIRTVAACVFVLLRLLWMAFVFHTACTAISVIIGLTRESLMIGMAVVTLIYTTRGGIRAVIWTDIIQFFVLFGGALFTVGYILTKSGSGLDSLLLEGWESTKQTPLFSLDPNVRTTAVSWMLSIGVWWIATCGSDQMAMQRFFSNRDVVAARRTVLINLIGSTVTILALAAIGLALLHYFRLRPEELPLEYRDFSKSGDKIFPYFISHGLPTGLSGLIIAALLAAAMSSLSSGLNSLTTVLTKDFFLRGEDEASDTSRISGRRIAKAITLAVGVITLAMAYPLKFAQENFIALSGRLMEPLTGPLFGLFAIAFFVRRANGKSAAAGFIAGLMVGYFLAFGHLVLGKAEGFSFLWIAPASIASTITVGFLVSRLSPSSAIR